ncbi:hypothetical protein BDV26DRAFT_269974 [Aspergillus bertholletiae]|uniref:Uncharacterized protein n=1 Tax=Aspergillus bertholletiae TaxID=1226010 RepID=A0A5N7AX24_9EURO|nr:hypothetical protein BDV26DRAFT_269974 [Aspergillus bertholletiae]
MYYVHNNERIVSRALTMSTDKVNPSCVRYRIFQIRISSSCPWKSGAENQQYVWGY